MKPAIDIKKIAVLGLGYVGLPTATIFASKKFEVIGIDIDERKIKAFNEGKCYVREPRVCELLKDAASRGTFEATSSVEAVGEVDAVIIAVPTPVREGVVDLSYLREALEAVRRGLHKGLLVTVESTIPPGTTIDFVKPFLEESVLKVERDFYIAHVPERIAPGKAIEELMKVPRVVGGIGPRSTKKALDLYGRVNPNLLPTDATTAEFVKLIENTFRDLNIAYANLLALIAEKIGVDVYEAIGLANTHPRVSIHLPGAGVGGPCLTKDPYMLASIAKDVFGIDLIHLARRINEHMPYHTVSLIERALTDYNISIKSARITILGAAYKGGVDDTRESPAKYVVKELLAKGASVVVFDPYTDETFGAEKASSQEDAVYGADLLVIITDHQEFRRLDLDKLGKLMRHRVIVDGRHVIEPYQAVKHGFKYYGIGFGKAIKV